MPVLRKDGVALLFVHIPKTGGGSLESAFRKAGWTVDHFDGTHGPQSLNSLRRTSPQHEHATVLESTFRIDDFDAVFCFVREPIARMRSEFVWRHRHSDRADASGLAFESWVRATFRAARRDPWLYDNHIRPQVEFVIDGAHVLRMEDGIEEGIARMADATGLTLPAAVPRSHAARKTWKIRPRDVEVNEAAAQLIADFYAEDYRRLGYERPDGSHWAAVARNLRRRTARHPAVAPLARRLRSR